MKNIIILFIIIIISANCSYSKLKWKTVIDNPTEEKLDTIINKKFSIGDKWLLDSLTYDIRNGSSNLSHEGDIYELSQWMKHHRDVDFTVKIMMNENYNKNDTTAIHWIRTRANNIKRTLIYFDVNPIRFSTKDTIVDFKNRFGKYEAHRQIIVEIDSIVNFNSLLSKFNEAYEKSQEELKRLLVELINNEKQKKYFIPKELTELKIDHLINDFHSKFYDKRSNDKFEILPLLYPIQFGNIDELLLDEHIINEYEPEENSYEALKIKYKIQSINENYIYQSEEFRRAIEQFLGYEFSYGLQEMTNKPDNIQPVKTTKDKFEFISEYIHPRNEYLIRDFCNAHMFWNHHWEIVEPNTIKNIMIDTKTKKAYIKFRNAKFEKQLIQYELIEGKWKFIKKMKL
jgi:hypothetical protein